LRVPEELLELEEKLVEKFDDILKVLLQVQ